MEMRAVLFKNGRRVCPIGQGTYLMGRRRSEEVRPCAAVSNSEWRS